MLRICVFERSSVLNEPLLQPLKATLAMFVTVSGRTTPVRFPPSPFMKCGATFTARTGVPAAVVSSRSVERSSMPDPATRAPDPLPPQPSQKSSDAGSGR